MAKVRIVSARIPRKLGGVGDVVEVDERYARAWARRGLVERVDVAPVGEDLSDLTVAELRERAEAAEIEVEGSGSGGNVVKADLVRALTGHYKRRDMRAE